MTRTIHFTTGLPGSGKTTVARQLVAESGGRLKRVNLDDIRAMTANYEFSKENENLALRMQDKALLSAIRQGFDVIIDNTHLHRRVPDRVLTALAAEDVVFKVHNFLGVPVDECVRRDRRRHMDGGRYVGREVIERMARKRASWVLTEEWLTSRHLRVEPYEPDLFRPHAALVDLDGTLCLHNGRSPYDTARCGEDLVNEPLARLLRELTLSGTYIVILSGRDETYRPQTLEWLNRHGIIYTELLMRPAGDRRRDDIVKYELFNRHVRDEYQVTMAFDDRDRVVKVWRALGITTAQMNWGDF